VTEVEAAEGELHFHTASALPEGGGILFVVHRTDGADTIELYSNGARRQLLQMEGQVLHKPVFSPTGHVLFVRYPTNGGIWALPFSLDSREPTGEPFLVVADAIHPAAAGAGRFAYVQGSESNTSQLTWLTKSGERLGQVGEARRFYPIAALSPDGTRIAVSENNEGEWDLWLYDLERDTRSRLTFHGETWVPSWSPDGKSLFYSSTPTGVAPQMKRVSADGSGETEDLGVGMLPSVSADGRVLVYHQIGEDGNSLMIESRSLEGDGEPTLFSDQNAYEGFPALSPDGRFLAYSAHEGNAWQLYLTRFPDRQGRWQVSVDGGVWPRWSADGSRLFYANDEAIFEVDVSTDPDVRLGRPRMLFSRDGLAGSGRHVGFDVTADGESFLVLAMEESEADAQSIVMVLNWKPTP
jgi:Tol biopolymer transport system component